MAFFFFFSFKNYKKFKGRHSLFLINKKKNLKIFVSFPKLWGFQSGPKAGTTLAFFSWIETIDKTPDSGGLGGFGGFLTANSKISLKSLPKSLKQLSH